MCFRLNKKQVHSDNVQVTPIYLTDKLAFDFCHAKSIFSKAHPLMQHCCKSQYIEQALLGLGSEVMETCALENVSNIFVLGPGCMCSF